MRKARSSPTQTWNLLGKLEAFYNFAASLFCTEQTLFRTILDQGSSLLSQSCNSCAARLCCRDLGSNGRNDKDTLSAVEIWAEMGQIWSNNLSRVTWSSKIMISLSCKVCAAFASESADLAHPAHPELIWYDPSLVASVHGKLLKMSFLVLVDSGTAWKNNLSTLLLLHLQYWHLCS